jgi:3-deoxy-7-phosphoheptulonate synthase
VVDQLNGRSLPPYVMIDCSHGNSLKDYRKQPIVAENIAESAQPPAAAASPA